MQNAYKDISLLLLILVFVYNKHSSLQVCYGKRGDNTLRKTCEMHVPVSQKFLPLELKISLQLLTEQKFFWFLKQNWKPNPKAVLPSKIIPKSVPWKVISTTQNSLPLHIVVNFWLCPRTWFSKCKGQGWYQLHTYIGIKTYLCLTCRQKVTKNNITRSLSSLLEKNNSTRFPKLFHIRIIKHIPHIKRR